MTIKSEDLLAREEIRDVLYRYCRAIDLRDWETVKACFAPDAIISHGAYNGPAAPFLGFARDILTQMTSTLHSVGGVIIDFEGELAMTNATYTSFHHIPGHVGTVGPVETGGVDTDWIVAGRYCDTLKKFGDEWKIIKRQAHNDWTRAVPSSTARTEV